MFTDDDWMDQLFETPWSKCYDFVEAQAKAYLGTLDSKTEISTTQLGNALWDPKDKVGYRLLVQRLFHAIQTRAKYGLAPYCKKAEPKVNRFGKTSVALIWFNPGS